VRPDAGDFREEPGAGKPPARICEGEAEWPSYSTANRRLRWCTATRRGAAPNMSWRCSRAFTGVLQTDAYAAYRSLADPKRAGGPVSLAHCWSHCRREFFDLAKSPPAPIATEALKRIGKFYESEAEIRGKSADERRAVRREKTQPLVEALKT
jgi:hypothetical protein